MATLPRLEEFESVLVGQLDRGHIKTVEEIAAHSARAQTDLVRRDLPFAPALLAFAIARRKRARSKA
jgi:hypothetical protein